MTFLRPSLLYLLLLVPLLALFLAQRERARRSASDRFISEKLRGVSNGIRGLRVYPLSLAVLFSLVALAGPAGMTRQSAGSARLPSAIILLDVSNSMSVRDVGLPRLSLARAAVRQLVGRGAFHRVALVGFGEDAEVISPLTTDVDAVLTLLDSLEPGEIGAAGSDLRSPLEALVELTEAQRSPPAVILLSDGEDRERREMEPVLAALEKRGIVIHTVMIGTAEGGPVLTADGRPLRTEQGETAYSRSEPRRLQAIAGATGGSFTPMVTEASLRMLRTRMMKSARTETAIRVVDEKYQAPLAAALLLLVAGSVLNRGTE